MRRAARGLLDRASSTVDRALVGAINLRNRGVRARAEAMPHAERLERLAAVQAMYGEELVADPDLFFPRPPPVRPSERRVRTLFRGGECLEVSWPSAFEPYEASVRERYLEHAENRTAHARLYASGARWPAVILVHGYLAGQWAVEERAWPIGWLQSRGLDVALAVLPFHAARAAAGRGWAPPFPGADPRFTNEGFRQAVSDLRALAGILRDRGAPSVGMMGMSLGGYATALMATLEPDLAFAVPLIPLSSLADFARDQGRLGVGPQADAQHDALEAANRVVSPLARPSRVPPARVLVVGAEADRITPIAQAERLATHLGAPLLRLPGGHLVQAWRGEAFRAVQAMLERASIVQRRR